jgi:hypothetical protein
VKVRSLVVALVMVGCSEDDPASPVVVDTGTVESAVPDTTPPIDSNTPDAMGDAPPTCVPDSFHPPHAREAKCTTTELGELHDACLGSTASTAACNAFRAAHLACYSCFLTDANAAAQGALSQWEQTSVRYIDVNVGGCLSLLANDSSATSCGAKWDAFNRCAIAQCCTATPFATFQSCVAAARTGTCKDLKTAYDACLPGVTNGKMCTPAGHSSPRDLYLYVGQLFCTTT